MTEPASASARATTRWSIAIGAAITALGLAAAVSGARSRASERSALHLALALAVVMVATTPAIRHVFRSSYWSRASELARLDATWGFDPSTPSLVRILSAGRLDPRPWPAQPDFEMLVPASLGSHVERLVRTSRASVLTVRDDDTARQRELREERARWVASLRSEADDAMSAGDAPRAERLLCSAKIAAPTSAAVEESLARAIEQQGRAEEADRHRALARWLRAEMAR